jgi:hypothetical protein
MINVHGRSSRLLGAVLLSVGLLAGCGDDKPVAAGPTPTVAPPPAAPKGYRLVKVRDHGFAIAVPATWTRAPVEPAKLREALKSNPGLPLNPDHLPPIQLMAYPPDGSGTNVNVIATSALGISLAELEKQYPEQVKPLKPQNLAIVRAETPAGETLRVSYGTTVSTAQGGKLTSKVVQYILIRNNAVFIATISQVVPNVSETLADKIGRTLYAL